MQRITGLPDEQVLIYEAQAEAALRVALADVMDKIARRIEASAPVLASAMVLVAADGVEDQGDEVLPSSVPGGDGLPPGQPYVSPDDLASIPPLWQQAVADQILPIVGQVFLDAALRTHANMIDASSIAGLPSAGSLAAEQYLAQARNTFEQIGDTLWAQARSELTAGFEAGESIPQLAERLRESANVTARTGVLVARTQVNEASNAGSFETARASGLQMQKEWIATPDLRTRPTHLAADGQRVDLNEPFIVGGFSAMFPAAPSLPPAERYSCRCTIGYVMPDRAPAQVRADDLATQQLEDLPGTASPIDDLAATQSARLQAIIDEQHAQVEGVIEDVHRRFGERFGREAGPGIDLPARGENPPGFVRPSLRDAKTPRQLRRVWQDEVEQITGFPFVVDAMPRGISMVTAREYAEGTLQMFAQFPAAKVDRIHWFDDAASSSYAQVRRGGHALEFNMRYASETGRPKFLAARRRDVAGWDDPALSTSWGVRNDLGGQGVVYHEFTHILDIENGREAIHGSIVPLLIRHAQTEGITDIDDLIKRRISSYATKNYQEMVAEAGTDVMVNGAAASQLSRDIFDLVRAEYRRRGFEIRTAPVEAVDEFGEVFPKAAAPLSRAEFDARAASAARDADALSVAPSGREPRRGPLTAQQSSAIARYIDQGAHDRVNTALREGRTDRLVDTLDAAFAESRLTRDVVVYRGAPGRTVFGDRLDGDLAGFEWDDPAYLSTSAHIERASGFGNVGDEQVLMRVLAPEGTPAVQASRFMRPNGMPDEGELLIGRGQRLRVVSDRIEPVTLYGEAVPTRVLDVEIIPRSASPSVAPVAAPRALSTQTVAQLRALAKERGIAIPAGARKADLVKALEEGPAAPRVAVSFDDQAARAAKGADAADAAPLSIERNDAASERAFRAATDDIRPGMHFTPYEAVTRYRGVEFDHIQDTIRADEVLAGQDPFVEAIDVAMGASPLRSDVLVYRGMSERGFLRESGLGLGDDLTGATYRARPYTSTATDEAIGRGYANKADGGVFVRVLVPRDTGAISLPGGEAELLLQRGLTFRIVADRSVEKFGRFQHRVLDVEVVPKVAPIDEKALLRAAARERNRLIESSQGTAKLLAEVDELIANKASKAAIRQRLDPALIAPEQVFAGADPAIVEALRTALDTGDPAKLRAALTRAGTKSKLRPISKAGAKTKFDPDTMEGVGGIDIPVGAQVTVVRRGTTLTLPDGSTMQLTRAQVTPIAPKLPPSTAKTVAKGDFSGLTRVSEPLGGNPGGIFEASDGSRWYVKATVGDEQARSEALALDLYRAAGLDAPELIIGQGVEGLGRRQVATRFLEDAKVDLRARLADDPAYVAEVQDGFTVDAWLANWDVIGANPAPGRGWDNIVSVAGRPVRIEAGGALRYRGLGGDKPFGDEVREFDTLRSADTAKRAAQIFGGMTPEQIIDSAERVRKVTPAKIKALVKKHGLDPELADTLIARRADILRRAEALAGPKPMTAQQYAARLRVAAKRQDALDSVEAGITGHTPDIPGQPVHTIWRGIDDDEIKSTIDGYIGNDFEITNGALRQLPLKDYQERLAREIVVDMDRAFDRSRLTADVELWRAPGSGRGIFGNPDTWGDDLAGFEWADPAYSSASAIKRIADRFTKDGGVRLRILAPKGSKALQLSPEKSSLAKYEESAAEAEILLARGARFRVVKDRGWTEIKHPTTHRTIRVRDLDVEVIVPDETPSLPWATK